ncbi:MAG TPA: hypothetical protein VHN11_06330 [Xanthobacteraceae bacterium]|jgi:hypothetical protein|nr:hypothetical protein [Xanthobacteraceae bacterium]
MTAMLLFWQGTVLLDCAYGRVEIVKHDAGTPGVFRVTNGALNLVRSPEIIAGMRIDLSAA